jgi:hypothetical protein
MLDLRKFLHRESPPESPETEVGPAGNSPVDIAGEYRTIIHEQLKRGGVLAQCVEVEVRPVGKAGDGRQAFIGMLRLIRWERTSAIRLLLGLPILESRLRRAVRGSWLHEVSHYGGVWVHASGQLQDAHTMEDLRMLIVETERKDHELSQPPSGSDVWSLPTDLGQLPPS